MGETSPDQTGRATFALIWGFTKAASKNDATIWTLKTKKPDHMGRAVQYRRIRG